MKKVYIRGYDLVNCTIIENVKIKPEFLEIESVHKIPVILVPIFKFFMKCIWDYIEVFEEIPEYRLKELVINTIRGDYGNGFNRAHILGDYWDEVQYQVDLNIRAGNTKIEDIKIFKE